MYIIYTYGASLCCISSIINIKNVFFSLGVALFLSLSLACSSAFLLSLALFLIHRYALFYLHSTFLLKCTYMCMRACECSNGIHTLMSWIRMMIFQRKINVKKKKNTVIYLNWITLELCCDKHKKKNNKYTQQQKLHRRWRPDVE